MTKKQVTALIDVVNYIIEHPVRQNIEFTTEVYDTIPLSFEDQVARVFEEHLCREVQINNNPDYRWAQAYVHKELPELIRVELIVIIP